ncbi:MAG: BlaI/MecI/CopY family transcriptional regulator, partial [Steroidobacteraceae bacterium]
RYAAQIEADAARHSALRALTRKLFKGSTELVLTHLVSDRRLSDAEVQRIRTLLDRWSTGQDKPDRHDIQRHDIRRRGKRVERGKRGKP